MNCIVVAVSVVVASWKKFTSDLSVASDGLATAVGFVTPHGDSLKLVVKNKSRTREEEKADTK